MDKPALVALRDRRESVIQILSDGFATDLLDLATFESRTQLAHQANNLAELDPLVADLPQSSTALVPYQADPLVERPERKSQLVVFANRERHGAWIVPRELRTTSVFGNAILDFRAARLGAGVTVLRVNAVFGNVEIIVPPQLAVESDGHAVFGNFEDCAGAIADPERPILRIEGTAVFGNVEISVRLPGESEREARKRQRNAENAPKALLR